MTFKNSQLLEQFEAFEVDPHEFGHRQHVYVAFEMLDKYSYLDACAKYAHAINTIATKAGAADKFNVTITFAFMSLIAERKSQMEGADLNVFLAANPDLLDRAVLKGWYTDERLGSSDARRQFLLPDKCGVQAA